MVRAIGLGVAVLVALASAWPADARFFRTPAERIDEVPVERLLSNLARNAQRLPPAAKWRAIGRVHLIAYIRKATKLPVYRERPGEIAEGEIGGCAEMDERTIGAPSNTPFPVRKPGELCEARHYKSGPDPEIPSGAHDQPRTPDQHLRAALKAYLQAKSLEADNLRTRLALAFVFDRSLQLGEARAELRFLVHWGIRRMTGVPYRFERPDWETHAVLSEAADHLARIPADNADRQDVANLKRRLRNSPPVRFVTPILVPLQADIAFDALVDRESTVAFDFTGQGPAERRGWLKPRAAWLVWDPKGKRKIISGFQLFGSVTWIAFWDNGYHALGSLDDNGDGRIAESELDGLALWRDKNGDGVSQKSEVRPVADYGIVALGYAHERVREELWISRVGATFADGEVRPTYDWVLRAPPVAIAKAPDAGALSAGVRSPVGRGRLHPTAKAE